MTDDLGGYFTDTTYPAQLAERMTPSWIAATATRNSWLAPDPRGRFHMLDIGCGDGLGLAVMAASHPEARFEGMDGMADHIARGRAFAAPLDNVSLSHQLFAEAIAAGGPPCDFITAHGVLAWVTREIRSEAMDLAAARLAPGGICAVSYNALPGWSGRLAYQHMIYRLAGTVEGSGANRFKAAHDELCRMAGAGLPAVPPDVVELVSELQDRVDPDYFPHEYLNEGWEPLWSAEIRDAMTARGLTYLGQAEFERVRPDLSLTAAQRDLINPIADPDLRDSVFDLAINSPFRVDLYGKAPRAAAEGAFDQTWLLARVDADAELNARSPAGTLRFDNKAARAVLTVLQDTPLPLSALPHRSGIGPADIRNAVDCLLLGSQIAPCAPPGPTEHAAALNRRLAAAALTPAGAPIAALAGAHGAVRAKQPVIATLHATGADIARAAQEHPDVRTRFLRDDVDPRDPDLPADIDASRPGCLRALHRLGVPATLP